MRASVLLSCLLTLAASGDDFCFARVVLSAPRAASSTLPLDDPNTDFVKQTDSWSSLASHDGGGAEQVVPGAERAEGVDGSSLLTTTNSAHQGGFVPVTYPPLRC
jgi:hypothetical protein